jgi:hypothetical protein
MRWDEIPPLVLKNFTLRIMGVELELVSEDAGQLMAEFKMLHTDVR